LQNGFIAANHCEADPSNAAVIGVDWLAGCKRRVWWRNTTTPQIAR